MKVPYALVIASLLLVPLAHADSKPAPSAPPAMGSGMMHGDGPCMKDNGPMGGPCMPDDLKLSADQKQKIEAIHEEAHQKVLKVLTPEQAAKMEEHRKAMMDRKTDHMDKHADHMKKRADKMKERTPEPAKVQ
ncbi:MAG: hypothetical protein PSX71_09215 [bacterium]|nr:hypothetical protein [bacterium]